MSEKDYELSQDPLWALPAPIRDKLTAPQENLRYTHFVYSGLYCMVAVLALVFFGIAALRRGEPDYALVILGFAAATSTVYGVIWYTRQYRMADHLITALMALLCSYLFVTGGTEGTGPLYLLIFPMVALFQQGMPMGLYSALGLLAVLLAISVTGMFGYDPSLYSSVFVTRVLTVYVLLTLLACIFTHFRDKAERELMLTVSDLRQLSYADLDTGLANRHLLEKMVNCEIGLYRRYNIPCSTLLIQPDNLRELQTRYGTPYRDYIERLMVEAIKRHTRRSDVPGRWVNSCFMILMPGTTGTGGETLAQRLLADLSNSAAAVLKADYPVTFSVGVAEMRGEEPARFLIHAEVNLANAGRRGGNQVIYG